MNSTSFQMTSSTDIATTFGICLKAIKKKEVEKGVFHNFSQKTIMVQFILVLVVVLLFIRLDSQVLANFRKKLKILAQE